MSAPTGIKESTNPQVVEEIPGTGTQPDPKPDSPDEPTHEPGHRGDCIDYGCGHLSPAVPA